MATESNDVHSLASTRASLLRRISNPEDSASWVEFYRLYKNLVHGYALRSGLSRSDAEEVTQDVFNRVSQTILEFESDPRRGTFRGWLRNLTRWRVTDKIRERYRLERGRQSRNADRGALGEGTDTIEKIPDSSALAASDAVWEEEWEHGVLGAALARVRAVVDPRHFQVFELHLIGGKSVPEIARTLEVNRATIYVIHHRLRKLLHAQVTRLKTELD